MKKEIFKAYDIRGQLGTELNEDIAYRIGRAYGEVVKAKNVVIGGDARETSEALKFNKNSKMMLLLRQIRDSVHKYVITYNRKKRSMREREEYEIFSKNLHHQSKQE